MTDKKQQPGKEKEQKHGDAKTPEKKKQDPVPENKEKDPHRGTADTPSQHKDMEPGAERNNDENSYDTHPETKKSSGNT